MGTIVLWGRQGASHPDFDPKAIAKELRERVLEELDYEHEADQPAGVLSRAYRGHPFIYVPDVLTRLSRRRVLVTEYVEGAAFRSGEGTGFRGAEPVRRDRLPLRRLRLDLTTSSTSTPTPTPATTC